LNPQNFDLWPLTSRSTAAAENSPLRWVAPLNVASKWVLIGDRRAILVALDPARTQTHRVRVARFRRPSIWHLMTMNLRNHRKSLIVDSQIAFTGGINIRHGNMLREPGRPVQDLHFRRGPVVTQCRGLRKRLGVHDE
jgi:phosphatidylserine/phosphatidylglycerophosphate/cardiolipin synthase-like enzyme